MPPRRLGTDEQALWGRVVETVRPLFGKVRTSTPFVPNDVEVRASHAQPASPSSIPLATSGKVYKVQNTLDGGWDRRLRRGVIEPDMTVDLHGHTLASAHAALDHALARALGGETRVILLVTGKPPREDAAGKRRGLIRASIHDWLAGSRFASRIAAVRNAHPRHGGAGALYVILRRERT